MIKNFKILNSIYNASNNMNKSSAVTEMGYCKVGEGLLCPLPWRELGPQLHHNAACTEAHHRTMWHLEPSICNHLATIHERYTGVTTAP